MTVDQIFLGADLLADADGISPGCCDLAVEAGDTGLSGGDAGLGPELAFREGLGAGQYGLCLLLISAQRLDTGVGSAELSAQHVELDPGPFIIEAGQHLTLFNHGTFFDEDFANSTGNFC